MRASAMTVRADGMTWPLRTYCDAYRMIAVDPFDVPSLDGTVRVIFLDRSGVESEPLWADQVSWPEALAYRLLEPSAEPCFWCRSSPDRLAICDACADTAEYEC